MRNAVVAVMLASAGLLAGCSESLEPELIVESVPPADVPEDVLLTWGQKVLEGRCMVEAGFRFQVGYPLDRFTPTDLMVDLYGRTDVEWAEEYGYGVHKTPPMLEVVDNAKYIESLSEPEQEEFWIAHSGDPETNEPVEYADLQGNPQTSSVGGCVRTAQAELYGDDEQWTISRGLFGNTDGVVHQAVKADSEYQDRVAQWSDCMAEADFDLLDRDVALETAVSGTAEEEIAIAMADATCLTEVGLFDLSVELHERERTEFAARYADEWAVYEALLNTGLTKAEQLRDEYAGD